MIKENNDKAADSENVESEKPQELKKIPINLLGSIKLSFQRLLPCCQWCCVSRRDRFSHKADSLIKEELQIVKWIKFMRITQNTLRSLLTEK